MPTDDAYSSGQLVLSHLGTCMCSNIETKHMQVPISPELVLFTYFKPREGPGG